MRAVLYLRSSKDRADVSIETQRQELLRVAAARDLQVVREFADVVESAKSEHRPAFQELKAALKSGERDWEVVLLLEPSRLSRNQFVAHVFTHDARTRGVKVIYARMPESNPMVDIIITPLMHGFAEYHSWESKQKGLAGMAENVKRGFRAGGRAPFGYRLQHEPTGAVREGQAVMKSKLVPSTDAPAIAQYLKARAYADIDKLDRNISKVTALLPEGPQRPLMEQIGKWETEREQIRAGVIELETRLKHARAIAGITERDVAQLLENLAGDMATRSPTEVRDFLRLHVDRIIMDPATLHCRIHYEIPAIGGDKLASPGQRGLIPTLYAWSVAKVA